MFIDKFSNSVLDSEDVFRVLYTGNTNMLDKIYLKQSDPEIQRLIEISGIQPIPEIDPSMTIEEFDSQSKFWFYPKEYDELDLNTLLLNKCETDAARQRVKEELQEFEQRGLKRLLNWLVYLIDVCNEHGIVRGVGRGSSVASYVLFLLGVHMVDPILYDIDYTEFFKQEKI